MRRFLILLVFVITINSGYSQVLKPVKWVYSTENLGNNTFNLIFSANIDKNWHLYSQFLPEGGPIPTSFIFDSTTDYEIIGKVKEISKVEEKFDDAFQMKIKMFSKKAIFVQKIKAKKSGNISISGIIEYQCCDESRCIPLKDKFSFGISSQPSDAINTSKPSITPKSDSIQNEKSLTIKGADLNAQQPSELKESKLENSTDKKESKSLWSFILLAFAAGIAGVFTPCVYPMIPMTVSFFMRGEQKRAGGIMNGLIFGLSIVFIYTMLGVILAITKSGSTITNYVATNWLPNSIFFLLFVIFALWFFGMFEIVLPGTLANKLDQKADKGGIVGAFFMALTLIIVSFSCTGPFIGAILVEATKGLAIKPIVGMFAYSVAFALPFVIFAISPALLKKMSKSGSWLNTVKVVVAFILLAFGLKFVSAIDSTYHLNILPREIFLSIWIVIFSMLGLYLIGKIKFPHDSDLPHIPVPRFILAVIVFSFVVYMIPGLFGAELKVINSLLPPASKRSTIFSTEQNTSGNSTNYLCGTPKYSDILSLPYGLQGYFDYTEGMACAKQKNKPVFLDIKGHACANCKKMETQVFSDPRVQEKLKENYLIIALYVDDKTTLPESEWATNPDGKRVKTTMGSKNLDFEIAKFNINTQPLYAILDNNGKILGDPMETNLNVEEFLKFLDEGQRKFELKP